MTANALIRTILFSKSGPTEAVYAFVAYTPLSVKIGPL